MVHYIRFLRTPQVKAGLKGGGLDIHAVVAVTTDLGDAYLGADVELIVRIVDANDPNQVKLSQTVQWKDGLRAAKIQISSTKELVSHLVRMHVTTSETISAIADYKVPSKLDVWSDGFLVRSDVQSEPVVERHLHISSNCIVRIKEETGDSIARHIWDASLGFLTVFRSMFSGGGQNSLLALQQILASQPTTRIRVLEVGAGCGIVGIALAQLRKSDILLTDLTEAQEILSSNANYATPFTGSIIQSRVLEWGSSIDTLVDSKFQLVLVSDCIYNPDSSLLLVETLTQLSSKNPSLLVLVGFKRRHDADEIFFRRMQETGFTVAQSCEISLPHTLTDYDAAAPRVEMFVYYMAR